MTYAHAPKLCLWPSYGNLLQLGRRRLSRTPVAFDGGYIRRARKGLRRNLEILTGASEKAGKITVFATAYKGAASLRERLCRFIERVAPDATEPTTLMPIGDRFDVNCQSTVGAVSTLGVRCHKLASSTAGDVRRNLGHPANRSDNDRVGRWDWRRSMLGSLRHEDRALSA